MKNEVKNFLLYVISGLDNKHLIYPCSKAFREITNDHCRILSEFAFDIIDKGKVLNSG